MLCIWERGQFASLRVIIASGAIIFRYRHSKKYIGLGRSRGENGRLKPGNVNRCTENREDYGGEEDRDWDGRTA